MPVVKDDLKIVAEAKAAHALAEKEEARASPSRWVEADCYAELAGRGWTQGKIAETCGVSQQAVSRFIRIVSQYSVVSKRPTFWQAFQEVTGKTTAELIVSSNFGVKARR